MTKEETKSTLNSSESLFLHLVTKEFQLVSKGSLSSKFLKLRQHELNSSGSKNEIEGMGQDLFHIRITYFRKQWYIHVAI